ncbi:VOC family protein [Deltaproteobacteria bacterium]|nr:VOC family protein [Deltaproteobacteria bacterium]
MKHDFGLRFHHLGLAIKQEGQAVTFLKGMGYEIGAKIYDPEQNVNLRLCTAPDKPAIELIMPGNGAGPLDPILNRYNELIYHSCYEVNDLGESLSAIEAAGLRVFPISEPKSAIMFAGAKVSFYKIMGFGLIELLETV